MHAECYCNFGVFYERGHPVPQLPLCRRQGLAAWGWTYEVYSALALFLFAGLMLWAGRRLIRAPSLHVPIHSFVLAATVLRILYLIDERMMLHHKPRSMIWQKLSGIAYSSFFPLSGAAFLCLCQLWLRLLYLVDERICCKRCGNHVSVFWLLLLLLEVARDSWYLLGAPPVWDAIYFFWLGLVDVTCALFGLNIAKSLYKRLRALMTTAFMADPNSQLFHRTIVSTAAVSATSVCFLSLSALQALSGRFYAWPCLVCWAVGRLLEAVYLMLILRSIGETQQSELATNACGSFVSTTGQETASEVGGGSRLYAEAFAIASPSNSFPDRAARGRWADDVLPSSVASSGRT